MCRIAIDILKKLVHNIIRQKYAAVLRLAEALPERTVNVMEYYPINKDISYIDNPYFSENAFHDVHTEELPEYEKIKHLLPKPIWDGHETELECYDFAWKTAFKNIKNPSKESGFVSPFIDTAFNGDLFMWDSSFILMFCKYASHIFNFQQTLDNFYAKQHRDGYICRQLNEKNGGDAYSRFDPASTGPNIMPWCEWEFFRQSGDKERLQKVFPCLLAYHEWLKENHTWRDGSYWSSGFGCGMDNINSRLPEGVNPKFSHGHMVWVDTNMQQVLSGELLVKMAKILGRDGEKAVAEISEESEYLKKYINDNLWDEKSAYYYDLRRDGSLNYSKHIGAYWALISGVVPKERLDAFVSHLDNPNEFKRPHRVPTVSADDPFYCETGNYWNGSVWAPTNYMVLRGLEKYGYEDLAYDIAVNHLDAVTRVYRDTKTVWENYAPELIERGGSSKADFVGWTGLVPISVMIEYVLGIRAAAGENKLIWHINRTQRHGVERYPIGGGKFADLVCDERKSADEKPCVHVKSQMSIQVEILWNGKSEIIKA